MAEATKTVEMGGVVLEIQAVNSNILRGLLMEFGDPVALAKKGTAGLSMKKKLELSQVTGKMFAYCAGWGVKTDPPNGEASELMDLVGAGTDKPHTRRADWIRYELALDDNDLSDLMAAVMTLTFQGEQVETAVPDETEKDAKIRELEERLAQMETE